MAGAPDWDTLITDLFGALDSGDADALHRLCRVDMRSELVGRGRLQRSRDGFFEEIEKLRADCRGEMRHSTTSVCVVSDYAIVEWVRSVGAESDPGIQEQAEGVAFLRKRVGRLELFRSYEGQTDSDGLLNL